MKLSVIGQSVVDEINSKEGFFVKPGGIFYSALTLTQVKEEDDKIFLITNISEKDSKYFKDVYNKVDLQYSNKVKKLPKVRLKIFENKERNETYSDVKQKIFIPNTINFNETDGILLNMISGFDITTEELAKIRKQFNGLIYFDIHSLARGVDKQNNRVFRQIPEVEKWLDNVDIVQCNENELLTITKLKNEKEIAEFVLRMRPEILIITKGEKGATLYKKNEKEIYRKNIPALKIKTKNKVGCGDVFGATFFYTYLLTKNETLALEKANRFAGLFTQYINVKDFYKLKSDYEKYYD